MKGHGVPLAAFVLAVLTLVGAVLGAVANERSAAAVRALERVWLDAYEQFDVATMDRIVADDFRITFPDGSRQDKAQLLAMISAPRDTTGPLLRFFTEDVEARTNGDDLVVLTGVVVTESRPRNGGAPTRERSRYTDTYARREGHWQVFASHLSNAPSASPNAAARRWVKAGTTIVSPADPPISITVDRRLAYVGSLRFPLGETAEVERFVFADGDTSGHVRELFVAQFEALLPAAEKGYTFPTTTPTRLGAHDYQTDTGIFDFADAARARPNFEADRTRAFLARHGLEVGDDDFLTARHARIVDPAKRRELILFSWVNLEGTGFTRADFDSGAPRAAEARQLLRAHEARARERMRIVDGPP
jgi:ketosteroid isomerase-like protein